MHHMGQDLTLRFVMHRLTMRISPQCSQCGVQGPATVVCRPLSIPQPSKIALVAAHTCLF